MPIEYELTRNGHVIFQCYTDPLDIHDVALIQQKFHKEILDHATHRVHNVTDIRKLQHLPSNILNTGMATLRQNHPMGGEIVIISPNRFLFTMSEVLKRVVKNHTITVVATEEEAWTYIDKVIAQEGEPQAK